MGVSRVFPKIGVPPNHPFLIGFSIINHPFWGYLYFSETSISVFSPTSGETLHRRPSRRPWRKKIAWLRLGAWKLAVGKDLVRIIPGFCGSDHSHVHASLHIGHVWPCKGRGPTTLEGTKTITMVINHWQNQVLGWSSKSSFGKFQDTRAAETDPQRPILLRNPTPSHKWDPWSMAMVWVPLMGRGSYYWESIEKSRM